MIRTFTPSAPKKMGFRLRDPAPWARFSDRTLNPFLSIANSPTLTLSGRVCANKTTLQSQLCGLATWHGRCSRLSSDSDLSSSGEGDGQSLPATSNVGDGVDCGDRGAVTMASSEDALADAVAIMLIH